jgi:c-di-GMP-binding flagellar brake protein YcgR
VEKHKEKKMERESGIAKRRKFYRLTASLPVDVEVITKDGKKVPYLEAYRGFTKNISAGGMFLKTPVFEGELLNDLLFKEKLLKLGIRLSSPTPVKVLAKAIWAEGLENETGRNYGLGMEFMWITKSQRNRIIGYINKAKSLK